MSAQVYVHTFERDLGYKGLLKELRELDGANTKVGLPAGGKTSGRYSMTELANVAYSNEMGRDVPERPFMRSAIDEHRKAIADHMDRAAGRILDRLEGTLSALSDVGDRVALIIKKKIQDGPFEGLHTRTIEKKGHDMPLVETGQLFESIQHKESLRGGPRNALTFEGAESV